MNQATEPQYGLPTTRDFVWAVVNQRLNGACHLVPVRISSRDDGERAFRRIRDRLDAVVPRSRTSWVFAASFAKMVVSTATVRYVSPCDDPWRAFR